MLGGRHPDTLHAREELARLLRRRGAPTVAAAGRRDEHRAVRDRALAALDRVLATSPGEGGEPPPPRSTRRVAGNCHFGSVVVGGPLALPSARAR